MRLMEGVEVTKTPRLQAALAELQQLIAERFPTATFKDYVGEEPIGFYLDGTVDLDDIDEVREVYRDRLFDLFVADDLPIYVSVRRAREREAVVAPAVTAAPALPD